MKSLTTLALVLATSLTPALAADQAPAKGKGKGDPGKTFAKLDADSDGKLTLEEYSASPRAAKAKEAGKDPGKAFQALDKDESGDLSLEEFSARPAGKAKGQGAKGAGKKKGAKKAE